MASAASNFPGATKPRGPTPGQHIATQGQTMAMAQPKDMTTASYCKLGQESVQEIVSKTVDIFNLLKTVQLPNGVSNTTQLYQERKKQLDEQTKQMTTSFKRLRILYDKVNEQTEGFDSHQPESLIPVEEDGEIIGERPRITEASKEVSQEHKEVVEQIQAKNRQLKEIIDHLRTVTWEINTMMAMRKT